MENKKKGFWGWGLIIAIIVIIVVAVFATESGGNAAGTDLELKNSEMTCKYDEYLGWYVEITGQIENTSTYDYGYVSVEFSLYDASGNNLGTAYENTTNLSAGETWGFKAQSFEWFDVKVVTYKLVDITCW